MLYMYILSSFPVILYYECKQRTKIKFFELFFHHTHLPKLSVLMTTTWELPRFLLILNQATPCLFLYPLNFDVYSFPPGGKIEEDTPIIIIIIHQEFNFHLLNKKIRRLGRFVCVEKLFKRWLFVPMYNLLISIIVGKEKRKLLLLKKI